MKRGGGLISADDLHDFILPLPNFAGMGFLGHQAIGEEGVSQDGLEMGGSHNLLHLLVVQGPGFFYGLLPEFHGAKIQGVTPPIVGFFGHARRIELVGHIIESRGHLAVPGSPAHHAVHRGFKGGVVKAEVGAGTKKDGFGIVAQLDHLTGDGQNMEGIGESQEGIGAGGFGVLDDKGEIGHLHRQGLGGDVY